MIVKSNYSVKNVLLWANEYLKRSGINTPRVDSELLLSNILDLNRNELCLNFNKELSENQFIDYKHLIKKRGREYPLDYILGFSIFMGLRFEVNTCTFIPRPETELLVEKSIEFIEQKKDAEVLEIGGGCGTIAVSLARFTGCRVICIEKNPQAIKVAKRNAVTHGVLSRIEFIEGDMFNVLPAALERTFSCLVSNPPYVKLSEYAAIQEEVKREPRIALLAGVDGLEYIRIIVKEGPRYIKSAGRILMEIGYNQKEEVEELLSDSGFNKYQFIKDYSMIDRIVEISL